MMKKARTITMQAAIACCLCCSMAAGSVALRESELNKAESQASKSKEDSKAEIPVGLKRLLQAYPDQLQSATANTLIWKDNTQMTYDDGIANKDFETLLTNPDLEDQVMTFQYHPGRHYPKPPSVNFDPGRIRYQPFFRKMYGSSAKEVSARLVPIKWLKRSSNQTLMVTSVNGVDQKLQAVSDELDTLPDELKKYLLNPAGTFNWRTIQNSRQLSAHSFGIAIDISPAYADYWEWSKQSGKGSFSYRNRIPLQIVEIFEKHGFIWGGKWYHYDTMHFEYRPELLAQ